MIKGHLDFANASKVVGWCIDTERTGTLQIEIYRNGELLCEHPAIHNRPVLHQRKLHPTGKCGFVVNFNESAFTDGDLMTVKEKESGEVIGAVNFPVFKDKIFFMHIAKASGTSLNDFIAGHYAENRVLTHVEGKGDWTRDGAMLFNHDFISGHLRILRVMRHHDLQSWFKVTMLRNPEDHLISHLAWVKYIGQDPESDFFRTHSEEVRALAKRMHAYDFADARQLSDFMETLTEHDQDFFDNCQTRYFLSPRKRGDLTDSDGAAAVRNLDLFDLIGVSERYDEFIESLCRHKRWPVPQASERLNVNQNKFGLSPLSHKQRKVLQKYIRYDEILYKKVLKKFGYQGAGKNLFRRILVSLFLSEP